MQQTIGTNYTLLMWNEQDMGGEDGGRSSCPRQGSLFWFMNQASFPRSRWDIHSQTISSLGQQQGSERSKFLVSAQATFSLSLIPQCVLSPPPSSTQAPCISQMSPPPEAGRDGG